MFISKLLTIFICCHGNQSSQGIGFVLAILKGDLIRNIPVKFYQILLGGLGRDAFGRNCSAKEDLIRNICAKFDHFLISNFREEDV